MNTSMLKGAAVGAVAMVVLGAGAVTGYQKINQPREAQVVAVRNITESVVTPQERCSDVAVTQQAPVKDEHRIAGSVVGGIAGGLLGSAIGGGSGKTIATVAGAAAGGYAGNRVQKDMQQRDTVTSTERRCRTVQQTSKKVVGYDVTYRLDGKEGVVRTDFKPGPTLQLRHGEVVTTAPTAAAS